MGDRAQVAIKQPTNKDPDAKIYLYAHWLGADTYGAVAKGLKDGAGRHNDPEYLSRMIFDRMKGDDVTGETGFGIGNVAHEDVEHLIPVLDCEQEGGRVSWEQPSWDHNKAEQPQECTFAEFIARAEEGAYQSL